MQLALAPAGRAFSAPPDMGSGTEDPRMGCRERVGRMAVGNGCAGSTGSAARTVQAARAAGAQRGFTATELLVTLAIAGVLMSLAVPGFASLARSFGLSSAANELLLALHTARAAAVLRGLPVAVCLTSDDTTCLVQPGAAARGWLVFVPAGAAAVARPAAVGEVLSRFHLPDRLTVSASRPTVTFWPVTRDGSTSTFDLCDVAGRGPGRAIVVSQTGRPRVAGEAASCA